jgi:uncharacterized protein with HEPN domain
VILPIFWIFCSRPKMRDLLIHAYARVDPTQVWDTVQNDLPALIAALEGVVAPEDEPGT